jgi:hypothetical protein
MTSWQLMKIIAGRNGTPFSQRRNYLVIPNVSWGFLSYEADMLVVSKSRYCTEIEIKISVADWKKDFEKRKHLNGRSDERIKYQYYAAPIKLAEKYAELELPTGWGVIGVTENDQVRILKEATARHARKLTDKEVLILARLACFRVWREE